MADTPAPNGNGEQSDLDYLEDLAKTVKVTSRCGLGQTSPHPIVSTLENFRGEYEKLLITPSDGQLATFDIHSALGESKRLTGRESVHFAPEGES